MRSSGRIRLIARLVPALVLVLAIAGTVHARPISETSPRGETVLREELAPLGDRTISPAMGSLADRASSSIEVDGEWTRLTIPGRLGHSAIHDPVRNRMMVFGGWRDSSTWSGVRCNDVWVLPLTGSPSWTQLAMAGAPPPAREEQSAVYDPVRDRLLVFGGRSRNGLTWIYHADVWALSLADGTPTWTELTPAGTPPGARFAHVAVYDSVGDRMVIFGGEPLNNEAWALSLAGTPAWSPLSPTGAPPSAREYAGAVYDPVHERMVLFGGRTTGSADLNDVWELSLAGAPSWTQLTPTGVAPGVRNSHSAVYDPARHRMLVFSGCSSSAPNGFFDTWALSLAETPAWTEVQPAYYYSPLPRRNHTAIYDPMGDRMVVFGGTYSYNVLNDSWSLSLAGTPTWTKMAPMQSCNQSMIMDPVHRRLVMYGGDTPWGTTRQLWAFALDTQPCWLPLVPTGTAPSTRWLHSAIYDPVRQQMVVFGGSNGSVALNDACVLSLADALAWTKLAPAGTPPGARYNHSAVYDPVRDRMIVFGGYDGTYRNDVWALSLSGTPTWTPLAPTGTPPAARSEHAAIYDPVRDRMVVFGGQGAGNEAWALSLAGAPAWTQLAPTGTPPGARRGLSAIYDPVRDRMVVFGGQDGDDEYQFDEWTLSLTGTPAWTLLAPTGALPTERLWHSVAYDAARDRALIYGGSGFGYYYADVYALDWSTSAAVDGGGSPPLAGFIGPPVPNPSRGSIAVRYSIARTGRVRMDVYDASGRRVRGLVDRESRGGTDTAIWDGNSDDGAKLDPGVYFVRLVAPGMRTARKVVLLK